VPTTNIVSLTQEIQFRRQTVIFCFFSAEIQKSSMFLILVNCEKENTKFSFSQMPLQWTFGLLPNHLIFIDFWSVAVMKLSFENVWNFNFQNLFMQFTFTRTFQKAMFWHDFQEISTVFVDFRNTTRRKYQGSNIFQNRMFFQFQSFSVEESADTLCLPMIFPFIWYNFALRSYYWVTKNCLLAIFSFPKSMNIEIIL
jgi:hypothetical protein